MTELYWQGFVHGASVVLCGVCLGLCLALWLHRGL